MGELGVERVWVRTFDAAFAAWSPERFARDLVAGALHAQAVVVGQNFRFGAKRAGDLALLRNLGQELGIEVRVHTIASDAGGRYSSSRARDAILAGQVDEAAAVLGRPHSLSGIVVRGDQRGRTIGFPTANIAPVPEMLPKDGVYAVRVAKIVPGGPAEALGGGVTNIGVRPTVGGGARTVETFVLDHSGELYGAALRVELVARLRGETKFPGLDALKAQIARDVEEAKVALGV
jgi:riboflavin kinase/FMN adenylyltransferase